MGQAFSYDSIGTHLEVFRDLSEILYKLVWNYGIVHEGRVSSIEYDTLIKIIKANEVNIPIDDTAEDLEDESLVILEELLTSDDEFIKTYALTTYIEQVSEALWPVDNY